MASLVCEHENKYQRTQSACRQLWQSFSCLNMSWVHPLLKISA